MRTADAARAKPMVDTSSTKAFEELNRAVREDLVRTTIVVADDVATWCRAYEREHDHAIEDFPTLAPPWPRAWIEYPSFSGKERRAVLLLDLTGSAAEEKGPFSDLCRGCAVDAAEKAAEDGQEPPEIRWYLAMILYIQQGSRVGGPVAIFAVALDEYGRAVGNRWMFTAKLPVPGGEGPEHWILAASSPALWTVALTHMRNVTVDQVQPPIVRRHRRRGALPPLRYHVLRLHLPRRQAAAAADELTHGLGPSGLHVVSGHFAHYGNCCPGTHEPRGRLFGRHEGVYWVPNHLRGSLDAGIVRTDLDVKVDQ